MVDVPGSRFELPRPFKRHPLKVVRLPISPPGYTVANIDLFVKKHDPIKNYNQSRKILHLRD
jgi:hypothetical protein